MSDWIFEHFWWVGGFVLFLFVAALCFGMWLGKNYPPRLYPYKDSDK